MIFIDRTNPVPVPVLPGPTNRRKVERREEEGSGSRNRHSSERWRREPEAKPVYPFLAGRGCPSGRRQPAERSRGGTTPLGEQGQRVVRVDLVESDTAHFRPRACLWTGFQPTVGCRRPSGGRRSVWMEQLLAFLVATVWWHPRVQPLLGAVSAFEPRRIAGDRQPRSIRWVSRPPERWRILGARRAGRDWLSPSGAASGSKQRSWAHFGGPASGADTRRRSAA